MDRAVPFAQVVSGHRAALRDPPDLRRGRQGRGPRPAALDRGQVAFQISQRAEFFEEVVGLETTLKRPIVNTRDEPHADPSRFRRLHVIVGDANLSEVATFLKVGTTALVLAMIEDDAAAGRDLSLADPVRAIHQVSADLDLCPPARAGRRLDGHRPRDPVGAAQRGPQVRRGARAVECLGDEPVGQTVLDRWEQVLHGLETDPSTLADQLDWVAKHQLHRGLPGPPRLRLGRRPPGRLRPAVPRPAARALAVRPPGHGAAGRRRRRWPRR